MQQDKQTIIKIPYTPRYPQNEIHPQLDKHRFSVLVAHRRLGKTVLVINQIIKRALTNTWESPRYAYMAPLLKQAKLIAWDYLKKYTQDIPGVKVNESELIVELPPRNGKIGARIYVFGADNPDALRGTYLDGAVLDEYGQMKPEIFSEIIRPTLADRNGWAVFIGCVTSDTLILSSNGLEEIGESDVGYTVEDKDLYGMGGFDKATHRFGNPQSPTIRIKSNYGFDLEATPNHRIWTPVGWKRLDELCVGDKIFIQQGQNIFGNTNLDPDFAYLLGLYLAEGSSEKTKKHYRITISNTDEPIINWLKDKYRFTCSDGVHSRKGSIDFCSLINKYVPLDLKAGNKFITKEVLGFDRETMRNFLSGYFDGDGFSDSNKERVGCCSSSEKLIKQLQVILLNFGIVSTRTKVNSRPTKKVVKWCVANRLDICGYAGYLFHKEIGFRLYRKQKNFSRYKGDNNYLYWWDRSDFGKLWDSAPARKVTRVFWRTLEPMLSRVLKGTYSKDLIADEIKEISHGTAKTFDFVIPRTSQYFSNGFISHNTPKGQNQFFDVHNLALRQMALGDKTWWTKIYRADETGVISKDELGQLMQTSAESTYRQEFMCDFSSSSDNVLLTIDEVLRASQRKYSPGDLVDSEIVVGVDPARYGDDESVICVRCGLQADDPIVFRGIDNMTLVGELCRIVDRIKPDAIFIDAGRGEGVIDRMRQLGYSVFEINFGGVSSNAHYCNKRTEMWMNMKKWILGGGAISNDSELRGDLITPTYDFDAKNRMRLETKDKIRERIGRSPGKGDALALTFALPVISRAMRRRLQKVQQQFGIR